MASEECEPLAGVEGDHVAGDDGEPASGSHSSLANQTSQPPSSRLNNLTLDELLVSPGREHLKKLHPKRPPGTLW